MSDNDPVTWSELEKYCTDRQRHCHEVMALRENNAAQKIEHERRGGMEKLETAMKLLTAEVATLKIMLDGGAVYVLPRKILLLLSIGMVGVGMAGKELIGYILKQFGVI